MELCRFKGRLLRTITIIVTCLFLFNDLAFADKLPATNFSPSRSHLAPSIALSNNDKRTLIEVSLICDKIERQAKAIGALQLDDIRRWEARLNLSERMAKNLILLDYDDEVYIKAFNKFIIRYFSPSKSSSRFILPGSKGFIFERNVAPDFRMQVYNVAPFLPASYNLEDIFRHIINKAGLSRHVKVYVSVFSPKHEMEKQHICQIYEDGTFLIHPDFAQDYNDIKSAGLGFLYPFDDGVVRWVDLADTLAYRFALHEFYLPGRNGHGHGYLDEKGDFQISFDEIKADAVGRRYSVIDDAMALWYYHSYTIPGEYGHRVRCSNKEFKRRLDWIFKYGKDQWAERYRREFPNLTSNDKNLKEAMDLALFINQKFFVDRRERGFDTSTRRDREMKSSKDTAISGSDLIKTPPGSLDDSIGHVPSGPTGKETAEAVAAALGTYLEANNAEGVFSSILKEAKKPVLVRIPVEILEAVGEENASNIMSALFRSQQVVIELFAATGMQPVNESAYARYGIQKRNFTDPNNRTNTLTLFITETNELINATTIQEKIGLSRNIKPTDTVLMPVGLYNEDNDLSGLVRSMVLGLRLMKIARDHRSGAVDQEFAKQTVEQFADLCAIETAGEFDLTSEELVNLAVGDINKIIKTIKKLIRLLPTTPIDPEVLRQIFQKASEVLMAA